MSTGETHSDALEGNGNPQGEQPTQADVEQATASQATSRPAGPAVTVDDSEIAASYANFCRVSSTPEELILDLGLNPQPFATTDVTIKVSQRIILNHYTAKRLLSALSMALQRHEQAFGVLETDVRRRVKSS